jgi:hypothetical protein
MSHDNQAEEDALRTINELNSQSANIKILSREIDLAEELLHQIALGKEAESEKIQELGLTQQSPMALKLRLKGILATKKSTLSELKATYSKNRELLHDLSKCPACQGNGHITKIAYDRSEGKITQITKTDECPACGGTGQAELSDHIKNLMLSIE